MFIIFTIDINLIYLSTKLVDTYDRYY